MSVAPTHIENTLRDVHWIATQVLGLQGKGNQLQLLIVILPEICGSYEKVKRVSETEIGVLSQCCLPKHAGRPSKQYLENVALELNFKFGGRKTVLQRALVRNGMFVSKDQTITSGADVAHPPPPEDSVSPIAHVKVCFCGHEIEMPVNPRKQTILKFVLLALMKSNIRARDFYLTLNGKMLDEGLMVNSVLALGRSSIHVVPRMRGGAYSSYLCSWYYPMNKIIDAYSKRLVRRVFIHKRMKSKGSYEFAPVLSDFFQYLLHYLLVCVCREGHLRDISWNGAFSLSDVLLYDGHMRISPDVPVHRYSPAGGAADYRRSYDIVLLFVDLDTGNYPVHVRYLLNTLLNADESVRLKPEFVTFLVNHPCLLTYAEKQMVYSLVDRLCSKLPEAVVNRVDQLVGVRGWVTTIKGADAFKDTYTYVPPQKRSVQNPPVPGAAVQNPPVPGAAVQNPPVHGAAVLNTITATNMQGYGQGVTHCLHLGCNFLNNPPVEADLETAEVALSYLLEFVLPEVLEVLSKELTGYHARTFMEIL
ncbi:uncharacterized protein LOC105914788 isoform X3 [Setaria italica]|nr:uncharacterized protein LOC105914788 isoform X3 [Setaria italica]